MAKKQGKSKKKDAGELQVSKETIKSIRPGMGVTVQRKNDRLTIVATSKVKDGKFDGMVVDSQPTQDDGTPAGFQWNNVASWHAKHVVHVTERTLTLVAWQKAADPAERQPSQIRETVTPVRLGDVKFGARVRLADEKDKLEYVEHEGVVQNVTLADSVEVKCATHDFLWPLDTQVFVVSDDKTIEVGDALGKFVRFADEKMGESVYKVTRVVTGGIQSGATLLDISNTKHVPLDTLVIEQT